MEFTARHRYLQTSPQKVRLVADLIRGKDVQEAANLLQLSKKAAAHPVGKVLRSAIANAESLDEQVDVERLYVKEIFVDGGPTLKRIRPQPMGRGAAGVRGIKLPAGHEVIALTMIQDGPILTATENGYGKRTPVDDFPVQGRGGQGVIAIQTTDRNGNTVGAVQTRDDDEVMLISSNGTLVRTAVADISMMGRNTQGVRLIRVAQGQRLVGLARIESMDDEGG